MKCADFQNMLADHLAGEFDDIGARAMEQHLDECESCRREYHTMKNVWKQLKQVPDVEPGLQMHTRFYAMLDAYQQGLEQSTSRVSLIDRIRDFADSLNIPHPAVQLAVIMVCLLVGFYFGKMGSTNSELNRTVNQLHQELGGMRQIVALSLLDKRSPVDRIRGIRFSRQVVQPQPELIDALILTLKTDSNVNVRLAAVDALYLFHHDKKIRQLLIESLKQEQSPLVQVSIIDLLVEMREKKALDALEYLITQTQVDTTVQNHARWGIKQLI